MLEGGHKAQRIHSPGTSSRFATGKLCGSFLNVVRMQDTWPELLSAVTLIASTADSFDLGQAAAYLQLAAWELGIGSCIASMWEPDKAKAILGVPHDLHFDVAISFGYPLTGREQSHTPKRDGRKSFNEVVFWERWGG